MATQGHAAGKIIRLEYLRKYKPPLVRKYIILPELIHLWTCFRSACKPCTWALYIFLVSTLHHMWLYYMHSLLSLCRCETALNFFVHAKQHGHLSRVKWFMFQDDDVYWRPQALIGILSHYTHNHEGPLAIAYKTQWQPKQGVPKTWTGAVHTRGFSDQHASKKTAACNVDCVHRYPWYHLSLRLLRIFIVFCTHSPAVRRSYWIRCDSSAILVGWWRQHLISKRLILWPLRHGWEDWGMRAPSAVLATMVCLLQEEEWRHLKLSFLSFRI